MGALPSTWFLVHPTVIYDPPNQILWKYVDKPDVVNQPSENPRLALERDINACQFIYHVQNVHLERRQTQDNILQVL